MLKGQILTTCGQLRGFEWLQLASLRADLRSSGQEGMHSSDQ